MSPDGNPFNIDESPELSSRVLSDISVSGPVLAFFTSAVAWLLVGTVFGVTASLKFNFPDWLGSFPALTFGRVRPAHLNTIMYGWISLASAGCSIWLMVRLCRVEVHWRKLLYPSAFLCNLGLLYGTIAILIGDNRGLEWLEFSQGASLLIAIAFVCLSLSILRTFHAR